MIGPILLKSIDKGYHSIEHIIAIRGKITGS
jgi:hypothetical protein